MNIKRQLEKKIDFSVIIPVFNEELNIERLTDKIQKSLKNLLFINNYEIIFVNDNSTDNSYLFLKKNLPEYAKIISLKQHQGQTAAISAGISASIYDIVGVIDADLQTDPDDFQLLIKKLLEGYYCVSGKKIKKQYSIFRQIYTFFAKKIRLLLFPGSLEDMSSSLMVFYKEYIKAMYKFDGFHRYIPLLFLIQGYLVSEVLIGHYSRLNGVSKYGFWNRAFGFVKCILILKWMQKNIIK
jgi:dolichol-phosphate mannosyltransferase